MKKQRAPITDSTFWEPRREPSPVPRVSLSIAEAATSSGLSKSTLYNLMEAGKLRFVKVGARRLIPVSALEALVAPIVGVA